MLECWSDGVMECWSTGVLEYWNDGVLEVLEFSSTASSGVLAWQPVSRFDLLLVPLYSLFL